MRLLIREKYPQESIKNNKRKKMIHYDGIYSEPRVVSFLYIKSIFMNKQNKPSEKMVSKWLFPLY